MNSKTTGVWFVIAAALCGAIFLVQRYLHPGVQPPKPVLPGLRPAAITSIQVIPSNQLEIRADRTNGEWYLTEPLYFPAQSAAIEVLLDSLQKLMPAPRITAAEMRQNKNADTEYGFDNPHLTLVIGSGDQRWQLKIGNRTPPGDQVYLRVVGVDGAFVADASWLKYIPQSADEWRDTSLVGPVESDFDWIVITNYAKSVGNQPSVIELRRDPTNHLWNLVRPLQARADGDRIADALQRLRTARVTRFITDNPKTDLAKYGLQSPELDLWLGHNGQLTTGLHLGKSPTNDPTQIYMRRDEWNAVFTAAKEPLSSWYDLATRFRDSRLFELTAPVAEIEMRGGDDEAENFTLQRHGSNDWSIVGKKFPVDTANVQLFVKTLADLRIADYVKDLVTPADLPPYGLDKPQRKIILRSAMDNTNAVIAELDFGTNKDDEVFIRRPDEDFIYAITAKGYNSLPEEAWEFRDRHIWKFNVADVAQVTLRQDGKTRQIIHDGAGKWSLAPGSQGIINPRNIEDAVQQLSNLFTDGWVGHNMKNLADYGFAPANLQITIELKDGKKYAVDFGATIDNGNDALAAVTLDGERWAFVFPAIPYQFVLNYLTIPAPRGGLP